MLMRAGLAVRGLEIIRGRTPLSATPRRKRSCVVAGEHSGLPAGRPGRGAYSSAAAPVERWEALVTETLLKVGDPVTVRAVPADPVMICLRPHAYVVDVVPRDGQIVYYVGHSELPQLEYGPFPRSRVLKGWRDEQSGSWL